jgi:hypothetical protein
MECTQDFENQRMSKWQRIKTVVRGAQAAIASERKELAPLAPMAEEALAILSKPPTLDSVDDLKYLLTRIQDFVKPWRPDLDPNADFYLQPSWAKSTDDQCDEALRLLEQVSVEASSPSVPQMTESPKSIMKIFISHSSADAEAAEALVELIRTALNISARDIRCTSVDGYKLSAGADSNEQLRSEVFECEAFLALLSPISIQSIYVMFELGARWGTKRYLAPIMISGFSSASLKAPLTGIHSIKGDSESDLHQLIDDLAAQLKVTAERSAVYSKAMKGFSTAVK